LAQNSHLSSLGRSCRFSTASLRWQMRFSNVSIAAFPAHAKRCLKQDGRSSIFKKMPLLAKRALIKRRNQLLQASLED
jgi:hypothetical protein